MNEGFVFVAFLNCNKKFGDKLYLPIKRTVNFTLK
jgi:hypothetical protein